MLAQKRDYDKLSDANEGFETANTVEVGLLGPISCMSGFRIEPGQRRTHTGGINEVPPVKRPGSVRLTIRGDGKLIVQTFRQYQMLDTAVDQVGLGYRSLPPRLLAMQGQSKMGRASCRQLRGGLPYLSISNMGRRLSGSNLADDSRTSQAKSERLRRAPV